MPRFVDVETPYGNEDSRLLERNILYARACVWDCLRRGEVPYASHLFFTQPGILDDTNPKERGRGIEAGKEIIEALPGVVTVVYVDLGISDGMQYGIDRALANGRRVEYRTLGDGWEGRERILAASHPHARVWGVAFR
jgi:hypothetical protein